MTKTGDGENGGGENDESDGDGENGGGDGDLLTMYAKAIPTPLAIVTEFRKVPLFQRNNLTSRGKSWIAVKSRNKGNWCSEVC